MSSVKNKSKPVAGRSRREAIKPWANEEKAVAAFERLPLAKDDPAALKFLADDYGLTKEHIPADWRIFGHPKHGPGVVYRGFDSEQNPVFKFKSFRRDSKGKRFCCFLYGGAGTLALGEPSGLGLVITGGEEKAAIAAAAGYEVITPLTGEAELGAEWVQLTLDGERPARIIAAHDNDKTGQGANQATAEAFERAGYPVGQIHVVRWPDRAPEGFDLNDLAKRGGLEAVREALESAPAYQSSLLPEITTAAALESKTIRPPRMIIEGLRPEGLTILASRPKKGKSWMELANAIAVATGCPAFGEFKTLAGDVLYIALEDSEARMQGRMKRLWDRPDRWPDRLGFAYKWDRLDKGGYEKLALWLRQHPEASMVVIDTFTRVRPPKDARGDSFQQDADATAMLQRLALEYHVSIVLNLHQRKAAADDPFDTISGTLGMTASPDVLSVLTRDMQRKSGELVVTGRDIEERRFEFGFDGGLWTFKGEAEDAEPNDRLAAVKDFLKQILKGGPVPCKRIFAEGKAQRMSEKQLRKAKNALRIPHTKNGFEGGFDWRLP